MLDLLHFAVDASSILAGFTAMDGREIRAAGVALGIFEPGAVRGALMGAFAIASLFLGAVALLGRSTVAFCGLLLTVSAAALVAPMIGVTPQAPIAVAALLKSAFAAATLIFVTASLKGAQERAFVGALVLAGALTLVGGGVINFALGGQISGFVNFSIWASAAAVLGLLVFEMIRGDTVARSLTPLAALAVIGTGISVYAVAPSILSALIFGAGVMTATIYSVARGSFAASLDQQDFGILTQVSSGDPTGTSPAPQQLSTASTKFASVTDDPIHQYASRDEQLAQVLDYAGVAVWDWSHKEVRQTNSFKEIMGADGVGEFTPDNFREHIHSSDAARFAKKVYGAAKDDAGFDEKVKLISDRVVRVRGARAVSPSGELERVIVFLERTDVHTADPLLTNAAASLTSVAASGNLKRDTGGLSSEAVAEALDNDEITVSFQPIVSLSDGSTVGFETLLRWPTAPDGLNVTAEHIIRAAGFAGRGRDLSKVVIDQAAQHLSDQGSLNDANSGAKKSAINPSRRTKEGGQPIFVAFNVALSQLLEDGFADTVKDAVNAFNLKKNSLVIELTETERFSANSDLVSALQKLKSLGVSFAIDDFGAGFTSFSTLEAFGFDYLKIDKSFTQRAVSDKTAEKIVASLAHLGADLGLKVIAEGIETADAAAKVKKAGCALGQGYYFGEPVMASRKKNTTGETKKQPTDVAAKVRETSDLKESSPTDGENPEKNIDALTKSNANTDGIETIIANENGGQDSVSVNAFSPRVSLNDQLEAVKPVGRISRRSMWRRH